MTRLQIISKRIKQARRQADKTTRVWVTRVETRAQRAPLLVLGVLLAILLGVISIASALRTPEPTPKETDPAPQAVSTYTIGESPRVVVNGQVQKSGVITIVASAPGVVHSIPVEPGQQVRARQTVVNLASNYSGGNAAALQVQIARKQLDNLNQTMPLQKEVLGKQRELAQKQETNAAELREISQASLSDTRSLLDLNEEILDSLDAILNTSTDSAQLAAARQTKAQVLSGVVQLRAQLRQTEYQASNDEPPAELARVQRDMTLKQLEIQEKSLELNKEISELQLKLAQVQAASMYPAAPFAGRIERVHVRRGQYVQPGTPLVTLDCDTLATQVIAKVPANIAHQVSTLQPSYLQLGNETLQLQPDYVSHEATDGQLYTVVFTLPQSVTEELTDLAYVRVELPLGSADTLASMPFLPLDSVHQNEQGAVVYVLEEGRAVVRELDLGPVHGSYVTVEDGLRAGDQVILERRVVAGQAVQPREMTAVAE